MVHHLLMYYNAFTVDRRHRRHRRELKTSFGGFVEHIFFGQFRAASRSSGHARNVTSFVGSLSSAADDDVIPS